MTNVWEACKNGSLEDVKQLFESVDYESWHVGAALHVAVERGSLEIVKYLVEHDADVNYRNRSGETILHAAAKHGHLEIVIYLFEHGADVNYEHEEKGTVLHVSAEHGHLEIVKYLFERGADVNCRHWLIGTALHVAVEHGHLVIVKYLFEHGADVNYEHEEKGTILHVAAEHGHLVIVKYLSEHGADVNYVHNWRGTALHVAVESASFEIVKYLVEHGADVNCKNRKNEIPLYVAVKSGCFEVVRYLIEHGADGPNEDKHFDYSLICLACEEGDEFFVDYLLRSEFARNVNRRSGYESSPLSLACSKGHTAIVRTLLQYNVDVRKEWALECRNDEIIDILQLELKKSVKHQHKIQILRSLNKKMTKVTPPLRYFEEDQTLSLGVSNATVVYVGILEDGSEVAVKKMFALTRSNAAENERKILELIDTKKSPFIVNYRHFFRDDTSLYLILDLCEETLRELVELQSIEYLRQHGPRMIKEILEGVEFLHELGILHRDLKPSNVLVDLDGHMRLADFGTSRVLNEDETTDYTDPKGTTGWMAAEVIEAIKQRVPCRYKKKSDVQVVGMIAYFILTKGKHPFGDPLDRMGNIVKGKPVDLKKLDYRKKLDDRSARKFVSWLISQKLEKRPYAHEALEHPFLDGIEEILQRPQIIRI